MTIHQTALFLVVHTEVDRQVMTHVNDSIATSVKEIVWTPFIWRLI